jgi:hypothetical protein
VQKPREVTLPELSGGLNTRDPEYSINDNQSPDMLNMWYKEKALVKRPGQTLYTTLANVYKASDSFNSYRCIHAGTNLYKLDGATETKITTSALEDQVAGSAGAFVEFNAYLWYFDGTEIWRISSAYAVTRISPYAPVVMINTTPAGVGTDSDAYNLVGAGFTVWFNGDGTATYQLPQTTLDATQIVVVVGGVTKTLTTHYTWVASTGVVTFTEGNLPTSGTNNVAITAYKTVSGNKARIAACKYITPYGGEAAGVYGGTRVFAMGNSTYPYYYWRSDLSSAQGITYWPDTSEELLDANSEDITGCQKMDEYLAVLKENSVFAIGYEFDGENVYYPVRQVFDTTGASVGCNMPGSVQLIDNKLVFAHSLGGVFIMTSFDGESNVKPLSANINTLLLKESNLTSAVSVDFNQCYWLCAGGYAYVWDYGETPYYNLADYDKAQRRLAWYRFNNINPTCMYSDSNLYYGSTLGIVKFYPEKNDFGEAITAYWKSKAYDMGVPDYLKLFKTVYATFASTDIYATITISNEDTDEYKISDPIDIRSFCWEGFSWAAFTWERNKFATTIKFKTKMKNSAFIQIKVEGNELNRSVGISKLKFEFITTKQTKRSK